MMLDEIDIIRAAVDGATNACRRITVSGARPRTIGVELSIEPTPALVERITRAISDAMRPDLATGRAFYEVPYEVLVWKREEGRERRT